MQLQDWLDKANMTHESFALAIGVTGWTVKRWCSRKYSPLRRTQVKIFQETNGEVKLQDWERPQYENPMKRKPKQGEMHLPEKVRDEDKAKYHGRERGLGFGDIDMCDALTTEEKDLIKALRVEAKVKKSLSANWDHTTKRLADAKASNPYGDDSSLEMVQETAHLDVLKAEENANNDRTRWHLAMFLDHIRLYGALYPKDYWKKAK